MKDPLSTEMVVPPWSWIWARQYERVPEATWLLAKQACERIAEDGWIERVAAEVSQLND